MRVAVLALACLATLAGCKARPPAVPLPPVGAMQARADDGARRADYPALDRQEYAALTAAPPERARPNARPLNALVLGAGGQYSAYAAGLLAGWRAAGTRPEFDSVCGVSSGALLAAVTFAGPRHDDLARRLFTETTRKDLFTFNPLELARTQSLGTADPLKALLDREVTAAFVEDVRAAHRAGRRLFVATMNESTRRLVVWDLGAVACGGGPDPDALVRKVLLASVAVPPEAPAVALDVAVDDVHYQERHVDGGGAAKAFLRLPPDAPRPDPADPAARWLSGSNLYVVAGGKVYADPFDHPATVRERTTGGVYGILSALYRENAWHLYGYCAASGMAFRQAAIPTDADLPPVSLSFDLPAMRRLYGLGFAAGRTGVDWRRSPPGAEPGEEEAPRTGFTFTTP